MYKYVVYVITRHLADGSLYWRHQGGSRDGEGTFFQGYTFFWQLHIKQMGLPVD